MIVGVGLATVDLLCVAPRFDERRLELSVFSMQGGGSAGNALATLAMLGAKARFFGRLGDDHFGRFILSGLNEVGVNTALTQVERQKLSPVSIVEVDEFTRKRKILFTRGSTSPLSPRDLPPRLLTGRQHAVHRRLRAGPAGGHRREGPGQGHHRAAERRPASAAAWASCSPCRTS